MSAKNSNERTHCARCKDEFTKKNSRKTKTGRPPKYCNPCNGIMDWINHWAARGVASIDAALYSNRQQINMLKVARQKAVAKAAKNET